MSSSSNPHFSVLSGSSHSSAFSDRLFDLSGALAVNPPWLARKVATTVLGDWTVKRLGCPPGLTVGAVDGRWLPTSGRLSYAVGAGANQVIGSLHTGASSATSINSKRRLRCSHSNSSP